MSSRPLALVGATIYVDAAADAIRSGVVLIDGDTITDVGRVDIPDTAERLDCSGLTVVPGFWNSHVHFFERKWAGAAAIPASELTRQLRDTFIRYGFTTVFDTGSARENTFLLRRRIESEEVSGPRILTTGEGIVPPGALPSTQVLGVMGIATFPAPEVADAAQAAAAARMLLDAGVDGVKLFASAPRGGALPEDAIRAATGEAHAAKRPMFVHPNSGADVLAAIRSGVDVIAHTTPHSGLWDDAILAAAERGPALTPTLTLWWYFSRHDRISAQEQAVGNAVAQLRSWIAAGGAVLFGTDLGAVDPDPSEEYRLMSEAGMSFRQILASLTSEPARRFGYAGTLGKIAVGFQADLTVLRGEALGDIAYTVKSGKKS